MMNTKEKRAAQRQEWISGRETEKYKDIEILISHRKYFCLQIWRGTAGKPYINYAFNDAAKRDRYIESAKYAADKREEYNSREKQSIPQQDIKKGDIYYCSWGYDQTNYDYVAVLSVSPTGKTVKAQRTSSLHMGTSGTSNVQEPIFCTFGDIFRLQVRDGYLIGSYPFCHDGTGSTRRGYFSVHTVGKQYQETMSEFGH